MQTLWMLSITMVKHNTTSVYMLHCGMTALLQVVPTALACLQAGRSSVGSRMKSTLPSLPQLTTLATPAIKAAFSPAPHNSLKCHLIPFVLPYFQIAPSSMPVTPNDIHHCLWILKNISGKKKNYSLGSGAVGGGLGFEMATLSLWLWHQTS